jgi:putative Mn2+ efflux pump MntP
MEIGATIKEFFVTYKGYLPGAIIMLIGLPIICLGNRRSKDKPENEEKKKQNN